MGAQVERNTQWSYRDGQRRIQFQLRKRSMYVIRSSETQQGKVLSRIAPFEMCATAGSLAALQAGFRNLDIVARSMRRLSRFAMELPIAQADALNHGTGNCAGKIWRLLQDNVELDGPREHLRTTEC